MVIYLLPYHANRRNDRSCVHDLEKVPIMDESRFLQMFLFWANVQ